MTNNFFTSLIISISYLLFKYFNIKYIKKEKKPIKDIILDSLLVFFSSLTTFFFINQFNINDIISENNTTNVFVDNPNF